MRQLMFIICWLCIFPVLGDVLYWQVNAGAMVDGVGMYPFVSQLPDEDDNYPGARVKIQSGDTTIYLSNVYFDSESQTLESYPFAYIGSIEDEAGNMVDWGTGEWSTQAEFSSDIGLEMLFSIELGQVIYDGDTELFRVLAESDKYSYDVVKQYTYERFTLDTPVSHQWMPTTYHTIPEPSTGLFILLGISLMILKRRRSTEMY